MSPMYLIRIYDLALGVHTSLLIAYNEEEAQRLADFHRSLDSIIVEVYELHETREI